MQRDYEITYILSTALDEEASAAVVERVNQLIVAGGGSLTEVHAWGRRHLAYPINHQRDGFYVTTRFAMPTQSMNAFENDLRLNENILRYGAFRQDEVPIKPIAAVAQPAAQAAPSPVDPATSEPRREPIDLDDSFDADLVPDAIDPDLVHAGDDE